MSVPLNLLITGAGGRMGRQLTKTITQTDSCQLVAAIEHEQNPDLSRDAGTLAGIEPLGITVSADLEAGLNKADMIIDFTRPEVTMRALELCQSQNKALVAGTTGMSEEQKKQLTAAAMNIPIICAPNFSTGINIMLTLVRQAALLEAEADIEILELHHNQKVDAPSGTALKLGEIISTTLGRDFKEDAVFVRDGITGARKKGTIGFASLRVADSIGEHTVFFGTPGERLEITHRASDRIAFARGAVRAALWLNKQPPGLYDMQDLLAATLSL